MSLFDILIAYVSWGDGGKKRPVLIFANTENDITVFNITTKYEEKSETIRCRYFKIIDWQKSGLDKQSWVDTNDTITLSLSTVDTDKPIGNLTDNDKQRLIEFLTK